MPTKKKYNVVAMIRRVPNVRSRWRIWICYNNKQKGFLQQGRSWPSKEEAIEYLLTEIPAAVVLRSDT